MLILPPGHAETVRPRSGLNVRERSMIAGVLAAVVALTVAIVVSIGTAEHKTANGCIDVKFPTTIGGAELYRCGAQARQLCASVGSAARVSDVEGRAIATQCRKAGLPVGS